MVRPSPDVADPPKTKKKAQNHDVVVVRQLMTMRPSPDVDVDASHMDEHWFAVVRMWQGLVRYDDKAWAEGAGILNQEPKLHQRDGGELPTAAQAMARQLHEVGARAANVEGQQARGEVYGRTGGRGGACPAPPGGGPKGD